jgi:tetratricopeptide (TPR) repeat protein
MSKHTIRLLLALSIALGTAGAACAQDDPVALFQEGARTVRPYLALVGAERSDPRSSQGQADIARGLELMKQATQARPDFWQAFWFIGKTYQATGDRPAAYRALKRAYELQPDHKDVAREYVFEAMCTSHPDEAIAAARRVSDANPKDAGLAANVALALLSARQLDAAADAAKHALQLAPDDVITRRLADEIAAEKSGKAPANVCRP